MASVDQGLVADRGPDPQPRLVQAALERGLADADDLCGLLGRKAFDVSQHGGRPVIRRQFGQGLAQRLAQLYLLEPPKRRHATRGTVRQVLVYDGDRCVGWCQFGSPPELPNINNRRTYDQGAGDPPDWRIGCIFTGASELANIDNAEYVGAVTSHEQMRSVLGSGPNFVKGAVPSPEASRV
jgi:hypothetical protein